MSDREFRNLKSNACTRVGRPQKKVELQEPAEFTEWFLIGVKYYQSRGVVFDLSTPGIVKMTWPGKPTVTKTVEEFQKDHNEYKEQFSTICEMPFEENAGVLA